MENLAQPTRSEGTDTPHSGHPPTPHPAPRRWFAGLLPKLERDGAPRVVASTLPVALVLALTHFATAGPKAEASAHAPALLLAKVYRAGLQLEDYWVSEKLDGVRAYWDGKQLVSRNGHVFSAPPWFTARFPAVPLDGELWMGRNSYEQLAAAVKRIRPSAPEWRAIRFMVFDLPASNLSFTQRLERLREIARRADSPYLQAVPQSRISNAKALEQRLDNIIRLGGEGLMLHRGDSLYRAGRSDDLLKVKRYQDAEAVVLRHLPGKGKYTGMLGALLVETPEGTRFRIGSGFSDSERGNPPALGTTITYKYYGLTARGIPRFASFLRIRDEP